MTRIEKQARYGLTKKLNFKLKKKKKWLKGNDIEMYSIYDDRKSVVAKGFIRTLKTKIHKNMTSIPKNAYMDK